VVLGCDLLYEPPHAPMLATAVAARLQPHGLAMLLLPIRDHSLMQVRPAFNLSPPPKIRHYMKCLPTSGSTLAAVASPKPTPVS
jgi:hypothetical protein